MQLLVGILILALLGVPLALALRRANELFCLRIRHDQLRLVRGRLPPRLFGDIEDVLRREKLERVELRVVTEQGRPRVLASGLGDQAMQRVRNLVGGYQVAQIRAGSRRARA